MTRVLSFAAMSIIPALLVVPPAQTGHVTGTVTYRERVALTPSAVVEVWLEDVSRPGAPARVVATTRIVRPGQVPVSFDLTYGLSQIDPRHRYAVRARIVDGAAAFATTATALVITQGHGDSVDLVLVRVPASVTPRPPGPAASAAPAKPAEPVPNPFTNLPATFTGTLPCADCPGIRYHLNLFGDDAFFLRMTYADRPGPPVDEMGSWVLSSDRRVLVLKSSREAPELFGVKDTRTLRKLDAAGQEIASTAPYELRRAAAYEPLDVHRVMRGVYVEEPTGGQFTECSTGHRWPVIPQDAHRDLEARYQQARRSAGEPLLVELDGRVAVRPRGEGPGSEAVLAVLRVVNVFPKDVCGLRFSSSPLEGTRWRLTRLGERELVPTPGQRSEPFVMFEPSPARMAGSSGCNQYAGRYEVAGDAITITSAGTMMACAPGDVDTAFAAVLREARRFRIVAQSLELFDESGRRLARFEAPAD